MILNNCIHLLYYLFLLLLIKQVLNAQSVKHKILFYFLKPTSKKRKPNKSSPPLFLSITDSGKCELTDHRVGHD